MASDASWPTEFADFKRLDAVLKCGICYEYMTNCMITSCSHTYCSLCIRKFMQYKNQCPACFEETYEVHLRNNRPLDEVISIFVKMKDKLARALRLATIPVPIKETKVEPGDEPTAQGTPKSKSVFEPKTPSSLRSKTPSAAGQLVEDDNSSPIPSSSSKNKTKTPGSSLQDKTGDDVVLNGMKIPGIFNAPMTFPKSRKPEEMASCPVCHVEVPARNINIHLDSCLAVESEVCQKKTKAPQKRDPLPKRLYNLLPDKALKKILKDYNLNTQGDRKVLISRIQRYTVLYNSENDSPNPRPVSELIAQLEREEREEKKPNALMKSLNRQAAQPRVTVDRRADPEVIDQANKAYRDEHRNSFKRLIESMRSREGRNIKPLKPPARVYSDDEDDPNRTVMFNPNVPSTSKDPAVDAQSVYSLATQSYDSDSDIFQDSDDKHTRGLIDWNKTRMSGKETLVISDDEDVSKVVPGGSTVVPGTDEETRENPGEESEPVWDVPSNLNVPSPGQPLDESCSEVVLLREQLQNVEKDVTPVKKPKSYHILVSPSASEKFDDTSDGLEVCEKTGWVEKNPVPEKESGRGPKSAKKPKTPNRKLFRRSSRAGVSPSATNNDESCIIIEDRSASPRENPLNDRSEKENRAGDHQETTRSSNNPISLLDDSRDPLEASDSDDSIDALFDDDKAATPRVTRSKSGAVSRSSTPSSSSSRGRKRKSGDSPKSSNLQETFDYLFEKYNGDRVDEEIESADSRSQSPSSVQSEAPDTRPTRRSTRQRKPEEDHPKEPKAKITRKRAKRDLSPAF